MFLKNRLLAIAPILSILLLSIATVPVHANRRDRETPHYGPILSIDQLILLMQATYPDADVERIKLENHGEDGLIYEVGLTDNREIYVDATSGEIVDTDD